MLNTHRDLILLFLSNAFVTLFLVHLVKFPHWLTKSPKIIDEYYVKSHLCEYIFRFLLYIHLFTDIILFHR